MNSAHIMITFYFDIFSAFYFEMQGTGFRFITISEDHKVHPHDLNHQQHMSWYSVLFVHSLIDLLMRLRIPLPRGLDYVSGGIAWGFLGMSFLIHSQMVTNMGQLIFI